MGTATVSGDGSKLDAGSALTPATFSLIVGANAGSDGSLTANMGGDVIARTTMGVGINGGKGAVDIDGAGSSLTVTNGLFIAGGANGDGMVTVRDSATASAEFIALGTDATSNGSLKIQNGSTVMTTSGPLTTSLEVGRTGTGSVEISGSSQYNSTGATVIGSEAGSDGTVTVTGAGSEMNSGRPIEVGRTGKGLLNVLQGAEANAKALQIATQGGEGLVNISGTGSKINIETTDNINPTASVEVGGDTGAGTNTGGTLKINNGGELNITSGPTAGDAILFISRTATGGAPVTLLGSVILGDDPSTVGVESGGTLNITSNSELAEIVVGRAGEGTLTATDSVINLTGAGPEAALFVVGGRSGGDVNNNGVAKGDVTFSNSTVTVDATNGGNSVFSVGRGTDTSVNTDPMTAPENTLLVQNGSTLNVINTGTGSATFNIARDGTRGTATIDGAGTTLNVDDTINIGRNGGFGTLNIQNGGTVNNKGNTTNIGVGTPGSAGVLNVNSGGTLNEATTVNVGSAGNSGTLNVDGGGNVVIGFDPNTGPGGTGNSSEDAIVSVGLEEAGDLNVTNSTVNITATGPVPGDSALLQIGGRFGGAGNNTANAQGDVVIDNSIVDMDATGAGSTVVSVGRGTDSTIHTDPATAPENTLTIQNGSTFNVKNSGTGTAFFNVARDNTRGTATVDGLGTTLNVDDNIRIGRDGGSGTLIIRNGATVNNTAGAADAIVTVGPDTGAGPTGGSGTLDINSGGTLNISSENGGDDAFLFIAEGATGSTSMPGTVTVETGGKINITAGDNGTNPTGPGNGNDAILGVGREGPGSFTATDSSIKITALGSRNIDNATVDVGGGGPANIAGAVGDMTLTNSNLTVETSGAGAFASIIVG
ncbi:MAG: beta strand repeat-containing protein, partial [Planctomycetota bacterium]